MHTTAWNYCRATNFSYSDGLRAICTTVGFRIAHMNIHTNVLRISCAEVINLHLNKCNEVSAIDDIGRRLSPSHLSSGSFYVNLSHLSLSSFLMVFLKVLF